jgi:hypothetical protein
MESTDKPVLLKPYDNNLGNPTAFPSFSTYGGKKTRGTRRLKKTRKNKGTKRVRKQRNKKTKRTKK